MAVTRPGELVVRVAPVARLLRDQRTKAFSTALPPVIVLSDRERARRRITGLVALLPVPFHVHAARRRPPTLRGTGFRSEP
jgi:hypothetical protein